MKKSVKRILAIAVILALALCVLSGCSDDTQAKIDEAVKTATDALTKEKDEALAAAQTAADEALKSAQEAADTVKGELEAKVADLEKQITDAADAAVKEKDEALAAAKTAADEALKSAQEAADAVKADLEGQVTDLTEKLSVAEGAKTELEGKIAELTKQVEDVTAAATEGADAAAKAATDAAEAAKKELEGQVEDLTKKLADAEAAKTELETKVADLEKQIADAAALETNAAEEAPAEEPAAEEPAAEEPAAEEPAAEEPAAEEPAAEEAAVMSHADYIAAELDTEVTVETYVQATQSWWDNKITIYAQSEDGAYFIYNAACSEEDAAKLVAGAKIKVKGFKAEWSGEVEIVDATIEFLDGDAFVAQPTDITALLGQDELIEHQNELVLFKGLTVAAQDDGAAFNYKNAENKTDDLYVRFTKDDLTFNFCVEFYLCGNDTETYKAVEALQVGDVVDVEGFLYWYEGVNTHITAVRPAE